jgi:hypothetical protein
MPTPEACFGRFPLKGGEPGRESEAFTPGERSGRKARRGLQGTPAARQSLFRGVRLGRHDFC